MTQLHVHLLYYSNIRRCFTNTLSQVASIGGDQTYLYECNPHWNTSREKNLDPEKLQQLIPYLSSDPPRLRIFSLLYYKCRFQSILHFRPYGRNRICTLLPVKPHPHIPLNGEAQQLDSGFFVPTDVPRCRLLLICKQQIRGLEKREQLPTDDYRAQLISQGIQNTILHG